MVNGGAKGDWKYWVGYLSDFLYVVSLVHTERLYRYSFVVVDALPNVTKSTMGDGVLCCLDELPGNDVGGW